MVASAVVAKWNKHQLFFLKKPLISSSLTFALCSLLLFYETYSVSFSLFLTFHKCIYVLCIHGHVHSFAHLIKWNKYFSLNVNKPHSFQMTKVFARALQMCLHTYNTRREKDRISLAVRIHSLFHSYTLFLFALLYDLDFGENTKNELFLFVFRFFEFLLPMLLLLLLCSCMCVLHIVYILCASLILRTRWCKLNLFAWMLCANSFI